MNNQFLDSKLKTQGDFVKLTFQAILLTLSILAMALPAQAQKKAKSQLPTLNLKTLEIQRAYEANATLRAQKETRLGQRPQTRTLDPIGTSITPAASNHILLNPQAKTALNTLALYEATVPLAGKLTRVIKSNTLATAEMSGIFAAVESFKSVKDKCQSATQSCLNLQKAHLRRFLIENGILSINRLLNCGAKGGQAI